MKRRSGRALLFHHKAPLAVAVVAAATTVLAVSPSAADPPYTVGIATTRTAGPGLGATQTVFYSAAASTTYLADHKFETPVYCVDDGWTSVDLTAGTSDFGDFAALFYGVEIVQQDPCAFNFTCYWSFFTGSLDDYTCGGFPAQAAVPHGSAVDGYIRNEIWSPAIALEGAGSAIEMRFDVYRELDLDDLVFYTWRVRSISSDVTAGWSERETLYYGPSAVKKGDWYVHTVSFGDLVEPGADSIQVALGVVDMFDQWSGVLGDGACHSHAPLFDNVGIWRIDTAGPQWHVEPIDLFQDNFSADGTATGTVRADIARDINPRASAAIRPGDSVVVWVGEPTVGLDYHSTGVASSGPAVYLHVRDVPPSKSGAVVTGDAARWPVVSESGGWTTLQMDSVRSGAGLLPGRFCADLNDELYTPGDTVEFYFSARDASGVTTYWTEFAGTVASEADARQLPMEMTCLPANAIYTKGDILYVDDADGHGGQVYIDSAFDIMGILDLVDRFDVRGPDRLAGNGLGSRVVDVAQQLSPFYRKIIWCSGSLPYGLIGDGSLEKSPDAQVLAQWLREQTVRGGLYMTGDGLGSELENLTGAADLRGFVNYGVETANHTLTLGIAPWVVGESGSMFDHASRVDTFVAYGGCPTIKSFDVFNAQGNASLEASYHYGGTKGGAVVSQRTDNDAGYTQGVVLSGFSFDRIREVFHGGVPARADHLRDILLWLDPPIPPPCGPSIVRTTRFASGVNVTWMVDDNCYTFDSYRVYRLVDDDTTLAGETGGDANTFLDTEPVEGMWSNYRVDGHDSSEIWTRVGSSSLFVTAIVEYFAATAVDLGIEVSWQLSTTTGLDGFELYRQTDGETEWTKLHEGVLAPSIDHYLDKTVIPGTTYHYHMDVVYTGEGALTGGDADATAKPSLTLTQNSPNPFNPATAIGYTVPSATHVEMLVFDVAGRRVTTLVDGVMSPAGYHSVQWDGTDANGESVASGVYFYRMTAAGKTFTKKMVIVR